MTSAQVVPSVLDLDELALLKPLRPAIECDPCADRQICASPGGYTRVMTRSASGVSTQLTDPSGRRTGVVIYEKQDIGLNTDFGIPDILRVRN